jgi:hypothetical protein
VLARQRRLLRRPASGKVGMGTVGEKVMTSGGERNEKIR